MVCSRGLEGVFLLPNGADLLRGNLQSPELGAQTHE